MCGALGWAAVGQAQGLRPEQSGNLTLPLLSAQLNPRSSSADDRRPWDRKLALALSLLLWPHGYLAGPVSEASMQKATRTKMMASLSYSNRSPARWGWLVHNP